MQVFTDDQLAAWAAAVPDIDKTVAPITDSMKEAVGILEEEFGPVELTLQGSYARSTAIPAATLTSCCTAATPERPGRRLGAIQRNGATRNFRQDAEDALRGWNGAAEMPRRAIWTSIDGVEVHVLPVLPYTSDSRDEGAWFWWGSGAPPTVTYPELITNRVRERDAAVTGRYCEVVRVFKTLREETYWQSDNLPGFSMIESLVYAVGTAPLSGDLSPRACCVAVLDQLQNRLANDAALEITDPSGLMRLFDGIETAAAQTATGCACGRSSCKSSPMKPACRSASPTSRPRPASETGSSTACSATSRSTGAASRSTHCRRSST